MPTATFLDDLSLLVRARHPIIFLDTDDSDRSGLLLRHLADSLRLPYFRWTRSKGLRPPQQLAADPASRDPRAALERVEREFRPAVYEFVGLTDDLDDALLQSTLRDAAEQFRRLEGAVIITGPAPLELPATLRAMATVMPLPPPQEHEYQALLEQLYRDLSKRQPIDLHLTREELSGLLRGLRGLTLLEAEKILTKAMLEDGRLAPDDVAVVLAAKREVVERDGLLEYYPVEATAADIAGLERLKAWLEKRRALLMRPAEAAEFGLSFPRGILLVGVQGAGKSLCAKAVAGDWQLPLLRMDPAGLYNKYVGETERNFRRAIAAAEKVAPVVLWLDEIEKAFAQGGEQDGGVSQRVLGLFLSWLQERRGDVFVVATANDVQRLPPELVRKGRFDEIFFVDLPDEAVRARIFAIHLARRGRDPQRFDLASLAAASDGFSGAEIEQVVLSSLYTAFAAGGELSTELLHEELTATVPLSRTMAEEVARLRAWAAGRAVPAH